LHRISRIPGHPSGGRIIACRMEDEPEELGTRPGDPERQETIFVG
jgi:hypothetical protein